MWLAFALMAAALWSVADIVGSLLVQHHERNPVVLTWIQSALDLVLLAVLALLLDVRSSWVFSFFLAGICAYGGWLMFYYVLDRVDVSITTAAWGLNAIFISIASFVFFGESWSLLQSVGVFMVLGGVFFLSYFHRHVSIPYTLFLFSILALLYAPFFLVQKAALRAGESIAAAFFWPFFATKISGFLYPLLKENQRRNILDCPLDGWMISLSAIVVICSVAGFYAITRAYAAGLASLVAVAANAQPLFIMLFARFLLHLFPHYAPRELLTAQSVQVKLVSFAVVFVGLALLALS